MKKLYFNIFISLLLCLFLSFSAALVPVRSVDAAALPAIPALVEYVLTVMGAVSVTDNIVGKVTGDSIITRLTDTITTCLGDGSIYVSADGDYVFNSDSTQAIYEAFFDDSNIDVKVISQFPDWRTFSSASYNTIYFDSTFISNLQTCLNSFNNPFLYLRQYYDSPYYVTNAYVFEAENIAYFLLENKSYMYSFRNNVNALVSASFGGCQCKYNESDGSFTNTVREISTSSDLSSVLYANLSSANAAMWDDFPFPRFLFQYPDSPKYYGQVLFYCNRSIVIAKNAQDGMSSVNQNSGTFYYNYYDIIPSVSQTVIEGNNWENIYNSYVTTVNNEYQTVYENNGGASGSGVSASELREILKEVGDRIDDIISDAGGEIIDNLDDILTWLSRIYDRLGLIEEACNGNEDVLDALDAIQVSLQDIQGDTVYLARLYALLGDVLNKINQGGSGRGYPDIVTKLPDVDNTNIMDYISTGQVIASTLETVLPFAYVPMMQQLFQNLSADPVAPHWEIPFVLHNDFVSIDENIVIDFENFENVRLVLNAMIMILFLLWLIWFTFYLTDVIGNMLF